MALLGDGPELLDDLLWHGDFVQLHVLGVTALLDVSLRNLTHLTHKEVHISRHHLVGWSHRIRL